MEGKFGMEGIPESENFTERIGIIIIIIMFVCCLLNTCMHVKEDLSRDIPVC